MPFATALKSSLETRRNQVPAELASGDSLEHVLSRHLLAVEEMADRELLTSILLLDGDGKRLSHGAAPNLPPDYCRAIDGGEIGPSAGSCGTAAWLGRPVYVTDIAADPLWADYRDLALSHGLRACWSTPIRDSEDAVIGTFAIYHRDVSGPTPDEVEAIRMITDHVAQAILWARDSQDLEAAGPERRKPALRLVSNHAIPEGPSPEWFEGLLRSLERLRANADELERRANLPEAGAAAGDLKAAAAECRQLIGAIRRQIEAYGYKD